jgi:hypothetical protein
VFLEEFEHVQNGNEIKDCSCCSKTVKKNVSFKIQSDKTKGFHISFVWNSR